MGLVFAVVAWLTAFLPIGGLLLPRDPWQVVGRFVQAPHLWLATLGALAAWRFSALRVGGVFTRPTRRSPLVIVAREQCGLVVVAALSVVVAQLMGMALAGIGTVVDARLLLMVIVMGVGAIGLGALAGSYLPRNVALVVSFAGLGALAFYPVTMRVAWPRSLMGGGWPPSDVYKISDRTVIGTVACFAALAIMATVLISLRASGPRAFRSSALIGAAAAACLVCACLFVRGLGYVPIEGRALTPVCSQTTPNWCVTAWNTDQLPYFVALNPKIHAIEQATGAKFPAELSQVPPAGPAPNVDQTTRSPLTSARTQAGTITAESVVTAAMRGVEGVRPRCNVAGISDANLLGFGWMSLWWEGQLLDGAPFHTQDLASTQYDEYILGLSPQQQGRWVNAIATLPADCSRVFEYPQFDSSGAVVEPVTGTGLER